MKLSDAQHVAVDTMLLSGVATKCFGAMLDLSASAGFKLAKMVIQNAGYDTREQYMAAEIIRLRKLLREK